MRAFETALGRPIEDDEIEPRNAVYRGIGRMLGGHLPAEPGMVWDLGQADGRLVDGLRPARHAHRRRSAAGTRLVHRGRAGAEGERVVGFIPYTAQFNMTGQPAISLPLHWTPAGLPVGVQLVAAFGREDLLIRVASQLERAAPWRDRHPPVHA